jgi:hypothetical protein
VEGGTIGVVLCMSSILFTLDVLDLVLMDGAGVGEMGGEGESSPVIMGIDMVGGPAVWLVLRAEGGMALCVIGPGGVVPNSLTMGSMSSPHCASGWALVCRCRVIGGVLLVLRLLGL